MDEAHRSERRDNPEMNNYFCKIISNLVSLK